MVQLVHNGMKFIPESFSAMASQTYPDIEIVAVINADDDGGKRYIEEHFPQVKIIDPEANLKFARGHNIVFAEVDADFYQLVNQDLILAPDYVEKMVGAFQDSKVGAVNGKIFLYDFDSKKKSDVLDTTGIVYSKNGRGRSRGQHEQDKGQYDDKTNLIAVDGAACMYRKEALESVKYHRPDGQTEYFDEDFEMYWEDVDLGLRLTNAGWHCRFVPEAIGYHGRTASASPGGYLRILSFIKHHRLIPLWIRRFNYTNHIFAYIKNSPKVYLSFILRELFYHVYLIIFERKVLSALNRLFALLPAMIMKRGYILSNRKITKKHFQSLLR